MLKIRLSRKGSKRKPFFKVVITDSKKPREGKFINKIGFYDPFKKKVFFDRKNLYKYISFGAKMTKTVKMLLNAFVKNNKK